MRLTPTFAFSAAGGCAATLAVGAIAAGEPGIGVGLLAIAGCCTGLAALTVRGRMKAAASAHGSAVDALQPVAAPQPAAGAETPSSGQPDAIAGHALMGAGGEDERCGGPGMGLGRFGDQPSRSGESLQPAASHFQPNLATASQIEPALASASHEGHGLGACPHLAPLAEPTPVHGAETMLPGDYLDPPPAAETFVQAASTTDVHAAIGEHAPKQEG